MVKPPKNSQGFILCYLSYCIMLTVVFVLYGLRLVLMVEEMVVLEATTTVFIHVVVIDDFVGMAMVIVALMNVATVVKIELLKVILSEITDPVTETITFDHFVVFRLEMAHIVMI